MLLPSCVSFFSLLSPSSACCEPRLEGTLNQIICVVCRLLHELGIGVCWRILAHHVSLASWFCRVSGQWLNVSELCSSSNSIKGLGYSNAQAQLFTVPPYAVALVYMLLLTAYSDKVQSRG